ncbi:MAG: hypothetical protein ISR22_07180 [Candidatus Poseidoniaceae archaeon]|nr:hypothetical protein [Candidatus Poseidoniaceae archaeon]
MNKMTPMILVMLMLTSVLASIDFVELQEMKEIEDTSGRASADPEVVIITSPRETTCDSSGDCLDELLAGDPVNFRAYLRNSGDADLDNMQYSVDIYLNNNGNRGDIATDTAGNELSWTNYNAVCNTSSQSCQDTVLAQGEFLTGGEAVLKNFDGSTLSWTPSAGSYFVVVSVTSSVLGDPGNNELSVAVTVRDYFDVAVDLTWLDGSGAPISGSVDGSDVQTYQVSVSLTSPGQPSMTIRNATVEVTHDNAQSSSPTSVAVGHSATVNTRETIGSGTPAQTGTRLIVGSDGLNGSHVGTATGSITPPAVQSGQYSVTAVLKEYVVYGPHGTSVCGGSVLDAVYCEKTVTSQDWADEYSGSNQATIDGSIETFQDISLVQFQIWKDVNGEDPEVFGSLGLDITSSLSPGDYELYAEVGHLSSSSSLLYNWSVDFTITDVPGGASTVVTANSCDSRVTYANSQLGTASVRTPDAQMLVYACASVSMGEGIFNVEAEANLLGQWDEDGETLNDKVDDMSLSNNRYDFNVEVTNFAPQILSLSLSAESLTADSDKTDFTATVNVFDVEGDNINYVWTDTSGENIDCESESCTMTIDESMVPTFRFNVLVEDSYGAFDTVQGEVSVWNHDNFSGYSDDMSIMAAYDITYKGTGLQLNFGNVSEAVEVSLPGYDGTYSSVGGMTISPATTYDTKDVNSQTMTLAFGNQIQATSMWVKVGNLWQLLATGTPDEYNATTSSYTYTWDAGDSMFTVGTEFHLFGGVLSQAQAPTANISGFTASASMAGGISISWTIDGTMLADDRVVVSICDNEPSCSTPDESSYGDTVSTMLYSGQNTVHGNNYYIEASVCDGALCSNVATATVVADKEVAAVTATGVSITESGETWVLSWNASSEDSDIDSWLVCYLKASFTASEMSDLVGTTACVATDTTNVTIDKYTTSGTHNVHFAIAPVDVVGNIASTASSDFIEYSRTDDNTNPDDGSQTTDSEVSSGVPTWTWGVIGLVVVVAFVAGAFILSRGDDGDDEGKDWDY